MILKTTGHTVDRERKREAADSRLKENFGRGWWLLNVDWGRGEGSGSLKGVSRVTETLCTHMRSAAPSLVNFPEATRASAS
jgi:hypothetical protein